MNEPLRLGVAAILQRTHLGGEVYILESEYQALRADNERLREDLSTTQSEFEKRGELWAQDRAEIERLRSVASAEMKLREGNFAEIERLRGLLQKCEVDLIIAKMRPFTSGN